MTQKTMSEKDRFAATLEQEAKTTLKILKAYPADQLALKPGAASKPAGEIAWMLVLNQMVVDPTLRGDLKPGGFPPVPGSMKEIIATFEQSHRDAMSKLAKAAESDLDLTLKLPVGPKQIADVRRGDALWMFLFDSIHHRGQLSVYFRVAGAKLPSIYGPTADEPWW